MVIPFSDRICVGIPIYKQKPDPVEVAALNQVFLVLSRYPICFVTHESLDLKFYQESFPNAKFRFFDPENFESFDGYNQLLLSKEFYSAFHDFEYLLIYQTDAWVFRDELETWCRRKYDYIGAPWFDNTDPQSPAQMNEVGNGGFCLRRVPTFLRWFVVQERLDVLRRLIRKQGAFRTAFRYSETTKVLASADGQYSIVKSLFSGQSVVAEDLFWSGGSWVEHKDGIRDLKALYLLFLPWLIWFLRKPSSRMASRFSFEVRPSFLYQLNKNKLPFGCHAWAKWEPEFWKEHIAAP